MSKIYKATSECAPSQEGGSSYIYAIIPTFDKSLAAITSANELLVLDRQNLSTSPVLQLQGVPQRVSGLALGDESGRILLCSGGDGVVATFDLRTQTRVSDFRIEKAITALASSGNAIAVGTELANHQAVVSVWDQRQNKPLWQNRENNDDITALAFHPVNHNIVLSGGDDGQVSLFDTNIEDEDDSLLQGVNHGPIHKAGFLGTDRFFALSSDQNLSVHPVSSPGEEEDPSPILLGDLRPLLSCEYVIDVFRSGDGFAVAAGSNISSSRVDIFELRHAANTSKIPRLKLDSRHTLEGAHGEEVVRSLFADDETGSIFTAGEDGCIRQFQSMQSATEVSPSTSGSKNKRQPGSRYKPY